MTQTLSDLLRLRPRCEARAGRNRCTADATVRLIATHPKREEQEADLCAKHRTAIERAARDVGYEVRIEALP